MFTLSGLTRWALLPALGMTSCGDRNVPSPFGDSPPDGGGDARPMGAGGAFAEPDAGPPDPPDAATEWGGPCSEDRECTDGATCTTDRCEGQRCHFVADDAACDDGVFCNGLEVCLPGLGCRAGEPLACTDGTACTIDSCDEATRRCVRVQRDADGDGDLDGNCPSGGDCDDQSPLVSSLALEVCGNEIDDDCDGDVDEDGCTTPAHDTCRDPLEVGAPGSYRLSFDAAALDGSAKCVEVVPTTRDLVVAVVVPGGDPVDVELTLTSLGGAIGMAVFAACDDPASEIVCGKGGEGEDSARVARVRLRQPPPGALPVYLFSGSSGDATLTVNFVPPEPAPVNETCGTALPLSPGEHVTARLAGTMADMESECGAAFGDLFYEITLTEARDVHVYASSNDGNGVPQLSFRSAACVGEDEELTCQRRTDPMIFRRAVPAGRHLLAVGATGPTDVDVVVETSPPSTASADETCSGAPSLVPGRTTQVTMVEHQDDIPVRCGTGSVDAAYALALGGVTDVLLVARVSAGDTGAVALAPATCPRGRAAVCRSGEETLLRSAANDVPAGEYRVVVESERATFLSVTVFTRPTAAPLLVPFSDTCQDALVIPPGGARIQGNTANATDQLSASCDVGGAARAPDQILSLVLSRRQRVVLDGEGSSYRTIVNVRAGATCPGDAVEDGCSAGYAEAGSFMDTVLPEGQYWIQIDGYAGDSGAWQLNVFLTDP